MGEPGYIQSQGAQQRKLVTRGAVCLRDSPQVKGHPSPLPSGQSKATRQGGTDKESPQVFKGELGAGTSAKSDAANFHYGCMQIF